MSVKNSWNFDPTHSGITFSVRHMVFAKVRGKFTNWSGELQLDPIDLTKSRIAVEIEAASIDTGVAERDAHLRSADFFHVARFPKLHFRSTRIESLGEDRYRIHGELTIRDVTQEVALATEYGGTAKDPWGNERAGFSASSAVNRKDFGLTWNQALETGGVLVGEQINIEIDVEALNSAGSKAA